MEIKEAISIRGLSRIFAFLITHDSCRHYLPKRSLKESHCVHQNQARDTTMLRIGINDFVATVLTKDELPPV